LTKNIIHAKLINCVHFGFNNSSSTQQRRLKMTKRFGTKYIVLGYLGIALLFLLAFSCQFTSTNDRLFACLIFSFLGLFGLAIMDFGFDAIKENKYMGKPIPLDCLRPNVTFVVIRIVDEKLFWVQPSPGDDERLVKRVDLTGVEFLKEGVRFSVRNKEIFLGTFKTKDPVTSSGTIGG